MKKLYFTILSAIVAFNVGNAQSLTQANNAPVNGDAFGTKQCDSTAINPGASGAGAVWSFSTIVVHPPVTSYTGASVASTGSTTSFPSAGVAVGAGAGKNSFYSSSATDLKYWGGDVTLGALGAVVVYTGTNSASVAKYPMTLGTTTTTAVSGTLTVSGNNGTFNGTCTATADGTGTLKLPSGVTFNNVIRVMTVQNLNFNVIVSGTITQVKYDYYNALSKAPLFTIASSSIASIAGNSQQTVVTVASNYITLGVKSITAANVELSVFPNPADDKITVSFYNENADNASYEVVNALGQTVKTASLGNDKGIVRHDLNIEAIPAGVYFLKLTVGNNASIQKISVQ